ncbi:MAG: lyase HEAT-like repeat protein [Gemmataceae bacterium]|nr:lyase HEAT-like repeat protein [Gemmataceae bacterium]
MAALTLTGCAGTWDTLTSRKFRKEPVTTVKHLISPEDPMVVLRASPPREGDERAKAMNRLKEPLAAGLTQQDQDEVIDLLARTAIKDTSPVLRLAAIEALGRFDDPRAAGILMIAYQKAHGRTDGAPDPFRPDPGVQQTGGLAGRVPGRPTSLQLTPPTGFPPETVEAIRCRALEAVGRTGGPEGVRFLASVADGPGSDAAPEGADEREVRLAALRGLGKCRQPEAVVALAHVLAAETGKDTAVAGRAHAGLVRLTGKKLPPDPQQWDAVVQAGVVISPEPTWVDSAVETAAGWVKR